MEMELDLILGDAPKPFGYLEESNTQKQQQQKKKKTSGLDFCMALGLGSYGAAGDHEEEKGKPQKSEEQEDGRDDDNKQETPVQLNLLPLQAPLPPWISSHLQCFPCSSDNGPFEGSSENGSPGNIGPPAPAKILLGAATAEEAPSANSPFQTDFGTRTDTAGNGNLLITSGGRRDFEATGNDVAKGERTSPRASEDDENGLSARKKFRLSKLQSDFLEERFKEHSTLNPKQKLDLAKQLNLRTRQVEVWFQNRRARSKMKQTEMEFEHWKRCCQALTEDNRRLHKELKELRSVVQASRPHSAQFPGPTLTTCPSCENAATSLPATAS